ncbi:MAG: diphthamide biosynthesis enzyme Dph2 [Candidatus Bathyarchaeota archaeon]|nr:diphthamide biosynthesis enzyme Dph2 [Candidatus Bathyarchaeota archaeon]
MSQLYHLELEKVRDEITRRGARRVLLQLPDGMRPFAYQMVKALKESTGAHIMLSGDSCYGACDLASRQALEVDADLLVHYGHAEMVQERDVPVLYVHAEVDVDAVKLVEEATQFLKEWNSVGLVTTIQHVHQVDELRDELRKRGFEVHVGEGGGKTPYPGQILGCYYLTAQKVMDDVEVYLYVGGGQFHPSGLILSTGKPVVIANPYTASVTLKTEDDLMQLAKKRMAEITATRNAKRIGVIVSSKPGQGSLPIAMELEKRFTKKGYEAVIIYLDEVRPEHLNNVVEPEAFVNTACPRIAIDGIMGIDRPMLSVQEAEVVLGDRRWEDMWGQGYLG